MTVLVVPLLAMAPSDGVSRSPLCADCRQRRLLRVVCAVTSKRTDRETLMPTGQDWFTVTRLSWMHWPEGRATGRTTVRPQFPADVAATPQLAAGLGDGLGLGEGDGLGDGLGDALGLADGLGDGLGEGDELGLAEGLGLGDGEAAGLGDGLGEGDGDGLGLGGPPAPGWTNTCSVAVADDEPLRAMSV